MREIKVWPHLTIVAVVIALIAGLAVGWWIKKRNETAEAQSTLTAGRIQKVDGEVAIGSALTDSDSESQWYAAAANTPFSVGDRIYTRSDSQASLAFSGRNFARLHPNTSLDVLTLDRQRTQLALRDGSALFDVGYLDPGHVFEVGTPYGAVDFYEPGLYDIGIGNDGNVIVSVLSGLAQVVGLGGSGQISKGEMLTLIGQTAADVVLSGLDGRRAGYLVDDYYSYQYPNYYDGRYVDYNAYLDDPYYFDPYRRSASYQYCSPYVPGLHDLDYYGDWQNVNGYGYAWTPRVDYGWSPYQQGYWINDYPYGPTWISTEPWGYAPYHYGRWAFVSNRWYWIPEGVNTVPLYSPALVAFIPTQHEIAWVPLGPGDPYIPRYYDANWNPYYLTRHDVVQTHVVNLGVPGAVAVLPIDDFITGFDHRRIRKWDRRDFDGTRAVLDPLTLTPLRNAVVRSAWGRGKIDLPPGIAKKLDTTRVVVSREPSAPPFRRDFSRRVAVSTVPEDAKRKQLKARDDRPNKQPARVVPEGRGENRALERRDRQSHPSLRGADQQPRIERRNRGRSQSAEGARVGNPSVERRQQPVRRAQPSPRRVERPARPDRPQRRPGFSSQPVRSPVIERRAPAQVQTRNAESRPNRAPARIQRAAPTRDQQPQTRPQRGPSPVRAQRQAAPARVQQPQARPQRGPSPVRAQRQAAPARVQQPQARPQRGGSAPARAQQHSAPARVQQQQPARKNGGPPARAQQQPAPARVQRQPARKGGGPPARAEQQAGTKRAGPTSAGGGKRKGNG